MTVTITFIVKVYSVSDSMQVTPTLIIGIVSLSGTCICRRVYHRLLQILYGIRQQLIGSGRNQSIAQFGRIPIIENKSISILRVQSYIRQETTIILICNNLKYLRHRIYLFLSIFQYRITIIVFKYFFNSIWIKLTFEVHTIKRTALEYYMQVLTTKNI